MRKYFTILLVILVFALTGCSKEDASVPETTQVNENIPEEIDVLSFRGAENATYSVDYDGKDIDITEYVISCNGSEIVLNSKVLEYFDFQPYGRKNEYSRFDNAQENETVSGYQFAEYVDRDGNLLQFEIGNNKIFYKNNAYRSSRPFLLIEGTNDFEVCIDFLQVLGISGLETSRDGNNIKVKIIK